MRSLSPVLVGFLLLARAALAQEDTTPPVLLDFTVAPVVFDAGPGPVTLTTCFTAQDDISGLGGGFAWKTMPTMEEVFEEFNGEFGTDFKFELQPKE